MRDDTRAAKRRLLIVEDDPKTTAVLRLYLEAAGFQVHAASDGPAGLARARRGDLEVMHHAGDGRADPKGA